MIRVVTDSSCDLPQEVVEELGIVVVPLVVRVGNEEFLETNLSIDEYWAKVEAARAQGLFPQTSQPSIGAFESVFAPLVSGGNEVVCVTITSHHSGTFNSAWAAAQRFGETVGVVEILANFSSPWIPGQGCCPGRSRRRPLERSSRFGEGNASADASPGSVGYDGIHQNGWQSRCADPHPVAGDAISED
jgi:hypothetical protein